MKLVIGSPAYSSWSLRPWMTMRALGIPFDDEVVRLRAPDTKANLLAHSSAGTVPVLVDGDVTVWDSLAIIEYLADRLPQAGIWPREMAARAHARAISAEMHSGFQPLRRACPMDVTKRFAARDRGPEVTANIDRICSLFREARARFGAGGPYLYGAFSAADGMYAPVCTRLRTYSIALDPVCQQYVEAVLSHPAARSWYAAAAADPWRAGEEAYAAETLIEDLRTTKA